MHQANAGRQQRCCCSTSGDICNPLAVAVWEKTNEPQRHGVDGDSFALYISEWESQEVAKTFITGIFSLRYACKVSEEIPATGAAGCMTDGFVCEISASASQR